MYICGACYICAILYYKCVMFYYLVPWIKNVFGLLSLYICRACYICGILYDMSGACYIFVMFYDICWACYTVVFELNYDICDVNMQRPFDRQYALLVASAPSAINDYSLSNLIIDSRWRRSNLSLSHLASSSSVLSCTVRGE